MKKLISLLSVVLLGFAYSSAQQKITFKIPMENNNGSTVEYDGAVTNGRANGFGKGKLSNGNNYEGYWKDNKFYGSGKMVFKNGNVYDGNWENGTRSGEGKMNYASGDVYDGSWKKDALNGKGEYIFKNGNKYTGDFSEGSFNGKGILFYKDSTVYNGDYLMGEQTGSCVYTFKPSDGRSYKGGVLKGYWHGKGMFNYSDGSTYTGDWVNGKKHGNGIYTGFNGYRYTGEFANDKKHGYGKYLTVKGQYGEGLIDSTNEALIAGIYYNETGKIFTGTMNKKGYMHGFVREVKADKTIVEAEYEEGKFKNIISQQDYEAKNGKINFPVLPDWLKSAAIIDTTIHTSKQYLMPVLNKYVDYIDAQKEFVCSFIGIKTQPQMIRQYTLDNTQKQLFFNVDGHYIYYINFKADGALVQFYTKDVNGIPLEKYTSFYLFKIPKTKPEEWRTTIESTVYNFKAENTTVKIANAATSAILVTQTIPADKTYNRKFYYVKNKGLYKVEDNGKLLAIVK